MKRSLSHLAVRIAGTPLAVHPNKLRVILAAIGPRIGLEHVPFEDPFEIPEEPEPEEVGGVAIIPIVGSLVSRGFGGMEALSGLSSYTAIASALDDALADDSIGGIVLDIDSFGGEAQGAFDLADKILAARSVKPIWAIANDNAFSAGYLLASAAARLFVTRTSGVGSIGVVMVHVDQSGLDRDRGLSFEFIHAGDKKVDGHPHAPLSDRARTDAQAHVDHLFGLFTETVAKHGRLTSEAVVATQAGDFHGEMAVEAGLADEVGTLDVVVEKLNKHLPKKKPKRESPFGQMTGFPRSVAHAG